MTDIEKELGWDDEITAETMDFTPLPPGEYDFEVTKFERGRYEPSPQATMPACPSANLEITVYDSVIGSRKIQHRLFLHTRTEWTISAFFLSIGQKKKDEPFKPDWQMVVGSKGRAKVGIRKYKGNNGNDREINEILSFLEPTNQAQARAQTTNSWQGGGFQ